MTLGFRVRLVARQGDKLQQPSATRYQLPGAGPASASTLSVHFSLGLPRIGRWCASSGRGSSRRATSPQNPRSTGAPVPRAHRAGANLPYYPANWRLADQRRGHRHRARLRLGMLICRRRSCWCNSSCQRAPVCIGRRRRLSQIQARSSRTHYEARSPISWERASSRVCRALGAMWYRVR